jgi:hypothetical protein
VKYIFAGFKAVAFFYCFIIVICYTLRFLFHLDIFSLRRHLGLLERIFYCLIIDYMHFGSIKCLYQAIIFIFLRLIILLNNPDAYFRVKLYFYISARGKYEIFLYFMQYLTTFSGWSLRRQEFNVTFPFAHCKRFVLKDLIHKLYSQFIFS